MGDVTDNASLSSAPTQLGRRAKSGEIGLSPRVELVPGLLIGERYRIEECIGIGGMATVFRAEHVQTGTSVAVKVLGEELARKPALVQRFSQEARAVSLIRHEHIVDITDFGHVRDDLPYYVMDHLEGETLADRLDREGRLPWPQARRITMQMCAALAAAHAGGVIHRDMKPENVFLVEHEGDRSFVKVLDFGIAKILTDDEPQDLTQTGVIMGTAAYMSPEQAKSRGIDARTDIYAAGIMLYEMLAGRVPFEGEGVVDVLTKHIIDPLPPLRRFAHHLPASVERVVHRALRKERGQRFSSAAEFHDALQALGEDGRGGSGQRRRIMIATGITAVVAAATVATVATVAWPEDEPSPTPPEPVAADALTTGASAPTPHSPTPPAPRTPQDPRPSTPPPTALPAPPPTETLGSSGHSVASALPSVDDLDPPTGTSSGGPPEPEPAPESPPEPEPATESPPEPEPAAEAPPEPISDSSSG